MLSYSEMIKGCLTTAVLAAAVLVLAGCGFRPMHADSADTGAATQTARVEVLRIPDRNGQILRNFLIDRFVPGSGEAKTVYKLSSEVDAQEQNLGTQLDATTTRARLTVTARFKLTGGGAQKEFSSRVVASYSTSESDYATLVAEQSATERALREIADDIARQITLYLQQDG